MLSDPAFDDKQEFERSALLLANGNVYAAFASYGDIQPYKGFMFAFNAGTLAKVAVWNVTPTGTEGGIWMGAAGPAADANGNIFVAVGNGTWDGVNNFGQSVVKLDPALHVLDYFAPFNANQLNIGDHDLGAGGVLLVPDQTGAVPHEAVVCGKNEPIYVLNRRQSGKKRSARTTIRSFNSCTTNSAGLGSRSDDKCLQLRHFSTRRSISSETMMSSRRFHWMRRAENFRPRLPPGAALFFRSQVDKQ